MTKKIVLTRLDEETFARAAEALAEDDLELHHAPWDDNTLDLVQSTHFDAIIIGFPGPITPLRRFVECLRAPGSACKNSGVILLASPQHMQAAQAFVGVGINRAIASDNAQELLAASITELAAVAPRLALRAPTRVVLHLDERPLRTFCQTENVSASGMLLRGFGHYPPGTAIEFEINIPGQSDPIRGTATITRTTNLSLERLEGVGARFESFIGQDRARLTDYLSDHLH
jgi:hypothetical protein